jgi:hypothetical protein
VLARLALLLGVNCGALVFENRESRVQAEKGQARLYGTAEDYGWHVKAVKDQRAGPWHPHPPDPSCEDFPSVTRDALFTLPDSYAAAQRLHEIASLTPQYTGHRLAAATGCRA